ncbi:CGNR zinc finger domain-containing protein [Streptomyces sp. NPDC007901]|uniref:CGNR zinc finger domain-containing protein n=1 Tax=Streptomyces sp. NPDC007901 TaxID=3364785 RepID=UPI0036F188B3
MVKGLLGSSRGGPCAGKDVLPVTDLAEPRRCRRPGVGPRLCEAVDRAVLAEPAGTTSIATDASAALALIAQDAVELLLSAEIRRVRVCGAHRCALCFLDRSPAHNRRWYCMSRCGNRTKVRLHQARARRSEHTSAD